VTRILPVNKLEANIRRDYRIEFASAGKIPDAIFVIAIQQSQQVERSITLGLN
jgi:hypothetical protein